jgi:hypothetical protein
MKIRLAAIVLFMLSLPYEGDGQQQPYAFNFTQNDRLDLPPGKASITWTLARARYGNSDPVKIDGKIFVASVMNLFEEVLYSDTVDTPIMQVMIKKDEHVLLNIQELGDTMTDQRPLLLTSTGKPLPERSSMIDSLNFMLLNGYFPNALSILQRINRFDLIAKVIEQYDLLFPYDYRGSKEIFNLYFDSTKSDLIPLPYITNAKQFLKALKKSGVAPKEKRFEIYADIRENGTIENVSTSFPIDKNIVLATLNELQIDTHNTTPAKLLLVIDTRKWKLVNKRALTNPASKDFVLRPRLEATGAVHR